MSLNQLQDFYKKTLTVACSAGATNIYVSTKPTVSNGYCVISPSNASLREIVRYTGTGTDGTGDYITIASAGDRGLGGTTAQTHQIGESIRMNITAEHWADLITEMALKYGAGSVIPDPVIFSDVANKNYVDSVMSGLIGTATEIVAGGVKVSHNQGTKPRARATYVREQNTPDKTLKVEPLSLTFIDRNMSYAGGNTPNFIDPALGGDFAIALQPANGETITVTVDGVATILTFVTTIGASAGNILIGASATTARANLVGFLNNPSVTSATQVAVTGTNLTAIQKLSATDDLSLNAFIRVINTSTTTFSITETLAGAGNIWTVNSTKNRYDLVVLDNSNTLQIRKGVEAVSPTVPTPTTGDIVICSVLNRVGQTTVRDYNVSGQAYITAFYDLTVYRTDVATTASLSTITKFGGTGADGALTITSGATNIDCANAAIVIKNYTSISITGTGSLTFTNPHTNGTIVILKSQGDVTLTSSTAPMIAMQNMGAAGGAGAVIAGGANQGSRGSDANCTSMQYALSAGSGGQSNGGGGSPVVGAAPLLMPRGYDKSQSFMVGAGGGGGGDAGGGTAGAGGRGGGGLIIECKGAWNFTTASGISVAGQNGVTGTTSASGGGGGGGFVFVRYGTLTANSGTITVSGGTGGTQVGTAGSGFGGASQINNGTAGGRPAPGGNGGAGWSSVAANTDFV